MKTLLVLAGFVLVIGLLLFFAKSETNKKQKKREVEVYENKADYYSKFGVPETDINDPNLSKICKIMTDHTEWTYEEAYTYFYRKRLFVASDKSLDAGRPTDDVGYYGRIWTRYKNSLGEKRFYDVMNIADLHHTTGIGFQEE